MVVENPIPPFGQWLAEALPQFLVIALSLTGLALVLGFLVLAVRYGPMRAGDTMFGFARSFLADLFALSPRRIYALAWLAVQESIRRRVFVAFGVFVVILLFAGWFLDNSSADPSTLYLSFVLTATTYLSLLLGLFLSAFSLPTDIKNRTIFTIVTKPVRPGEIVLGRIIGFSLVGTMLLGVMGIFSYFFVVRLLNHTHEVVVEQLETVDDEGKSWQKGQTTTDHAHHHQIEIDADGNPRVLPTKGHTHEITAVKTGDKTKYVLGGPQGMFNARVPIYGKLSFRDRTGQVGKGVSVGSEWRYRSFVEGGVPAAAVWTLSDITPEKYPDGLPLEMTIRVFRTYKGDSERGILGSIALKNPRTGRTSAIQTFRAKDATIDKHFISRKLKDAGASGEKKGDSQAAADIDLFEDLVSGGQVEVWIQCLESQQYFGVAQPDLYIADQEGSFRLNFVKAYLGIWLQMILVTSFGVMFSTFLSGAVALLATLAALLLGFFTTFVVELADGKIQGGGPIEAAIRTAQQSNVTSKMEPSLATSVIQSIDAVLLTVMKFVAQTLPDFRKFTNVDYVAHGFDVPPDMVLEQTLGTLGFMVAIFVVSYVFLKTREVAK